MHANYPGSGWYIVAYHLRKRLCRDPRSVSVQRRHDRCVYTISHSKYICFCNFVILSFIREKIQGDEVEVEKILIVIFINRMRINMSLAKRRFSEFSLSFSPSLMLRFRLVATNGSSSKKNDSIKPTLFQQLCTHMYYIYTTS